MIDREKLIDLIGQKIESVWGVDDDDIMGIACESFEKLADHLLANGVTFASAVPGPSDADPNIMELCFRNGEQHMKEKVILILDVFDKDYPYIDFDALRKAIEGV